MNFSIVNLLFFVSSFHLSLLVYNLVIIWNLGGIVEASLAKRQRRFIQEYFNELLLEGHFIPLTGSQGEKE